MTNYLSCHFLEKDQPYKETIERGSLVTLSYLSCFPMISRLLWISFGFNLPLLWVVGFLTGSLIDLGLYGLSEKYPEKFRYKNTPLEAGGFVLPLFFFTLVSFLK